MKSFKKISSTYNQTCLWRSKPHLYNVANGTYGVEQYTIYTAITKNPAKTHIKDVHHGFVSNGKKIQNV